MYKDNDIPRIQIFTGHFGSGKTEIALNYALRLNDMGIKTCIVDADIVNPYFCTRDEEEFLTGRGIRVISTSKKLSNAELATVPDNIMSAFDDKSMHVIFDVGGDDTGAVVLGQFNRFFKEEKYDMYFVINTLRPLTQNPEDIMNYMNEIQNASRLKINYLINNTNLMQETTKEQIIKGQDIIEIVAEKTGKPVKYTAVREDITFDSSEVKNDILPLKLYMLPPWEKA